MKPDDVLVRENLMDLVYFLRHHKAPQGGPELCDWSCECNGRLDQIVAHDAALRELLADCREIMADAAESPVEVHRDYRERFAELVAQIDEASPTGPPEEESDDR